MQNKTKKIYWEHFEHPADIGIRGAGNTKAEAFEQAAIALTAVIADPDRVESKDKIEICCEADDDEMLFIEWLNCLIFEMACRKMLFSRFEVAIENNKLSALCFGEKIDIAKHSPAVEVKAATYMMLSVKKNENGIWMAQCVVDV